MKFQSWRFAEISNEGVNCLMSAGYPCLISNVLSSRGINSEDAAAEFLAKENSLTWSPFLMKDMDKAVERITEAIINEERIAVFGDYDVDGITATCILVDFLKAKGADVIHYIPRRDEEGYGLSADAISNLHERGVDLLITVDCGITGVEEVLVAKSYGMDVVITDHHECKEVLPDACAVVDPHRPDCEYPFKHLAGCGVAMKLVLALGGSDREGALFSRYCTLAAIGTIADVMQMSGENRTIVHRGLDALDHTDFIGLHALLQEAGLADKEISSVQIGFVLAPRINAAGRMGAADMASDLLLCDDPEKAEQMAKDLCALNRERQSVEQEIYSQAEMIISEMPEEERNALILSSDQWHQGVVGIVASRLSEKYSRPSFMIHLNNGVGKGSCRSWGGFNLFTALECCSDLLLGFGGHELAAGFTIEEERIPDFRERMNQLAKDFRGGTRPVSVLDIDVIINQCSSITLSELEDLSVLEPYGSGNSRPIFCLMGATIQRLQSVGQNRHLKFKVCKGTSQFDAIFFSTTLDEIQCKDGDRIDIAFYLQINEFRGTRSVQLQTIDLRPSLVPSAKEQEVLALVEKCVSGAPIDAHNAMHALPSREHFVRAWRTLEHEVADDELCTAYLPLLRIISSNLGRTDAFLHAAICFEVFSDLGLINCERSGDNVTIHLTSNGKKVNIEDSHYIRSLRSQVISREGETT